MTRRWAVGAGAVGLALALPLGSSATFPYLDGPPPGHTGGFGEPTCRTCHLGSASTAGAAIEWVGLPAAWRAGEAYRFTLVLRSRAARRGGFQLSSRHADGALSGRQAGTLGVSETIGAITFGPNGVGYAHHRADGTARADSMPFSWDLTWIAPDTGSAVIFHVAANAANDDNSELGDAIVTAAVTVQRARP